MKKTLTIIGLAVATLAGAQAQVITVFSQNFAAGGVTSDYVSASSPTTGQWNAISSSGGAKTWSIASNTLQLASTGTNGGFASRTTDFTPTVNLMSFSFTFNLTAGTTATTNAFEVSVGSGFTTNNSQEPNASVYSKFGINTTATTGFIVRDISGSTNGSSTFTGAQTISWFANNTGASATYLAPDGSTESIANDTFDLWVGTSKQLNDRGVTTTTQTITDFKIGSSANAAFTGRFDDIVIQQVPEPKTWVMIGIGSAFMLWNLRRKRRFDV